MVVTLSPRLEELVRRKVETGPYRSADEVVADALRLLDERDRRDTFEAEMKKGFDQLARFPNLGRVVAGSRAGARRSRVEQHVMFSEADEEEVRIGRVVHRRMEGTEEPAG